MIRSSALFSAIVALATAIPLSAADYRRQLETNYDCYELIYSDSPILVVNTARYRLYFQYEPGSPIGLDTALAWIDAGADRVEQMMGKPFKQRFNVFIPQRIETKPGSNSGNVLGLRFEQNNRHCVAFCRRAFCIGLISHELAHEWLSSYSMRPVSWSAEEGICEYLEHPEKFHPSRWRLLRDRGPMKRDSIAGAAKSADESHARATRWSQVYWLRHVHPKRFTLSEIARLQESDFPDPESIFRDLEKRWEDEQENQQREQKEL